MRRFLLCAVLAAGMQQANAQQLQLTNQPAPTTFDTGNLLAKAPASQKTVWPNRQAATDTLTVYTSRLVQYDTPKRKSLTETLFEPVLASL